MIQIHSYIYEPEAGIRNFKPSNCRYKGTVLVPGSQFLIPESYLLKKFKYLYFLSVTRTFCP